MTTLRIYTNPIGYLGNEIDNYKKGVLCDSIQELASWVETFKPQTDNGDVLHIVDDWTGEDVTTKALDIVTSYNELTKRLEELEYIL